MARDFTVERRYAHRPERVWMIDPIDGLNDTSVNRPINPSWGRKRRIWQRLMLFRTFFHGLLIDGVSKANGGFQIIKMDGVKGSHFKHFLSIGAAMR